jgi:hypothetical protein
MTTSMWATMMTPARLLAAHSFGMSPIDVWRFGDCVGEAEAIPGGQLLTS